MRSRPIRSLYSRAASEIKDASALEVLFKVGIHAVADRVIDEVPMAPGEFLIPKRHLDL